METTATPAAPRIQAKRRPSKTRLVLRFCGHLALAVFVSVGLMTMANQQQAMAAAASFPSHTATAGRCESSVATGRTVIAFAPKQVIGRVAGMGEQVRWSPDLYRFQNGQWQLYDQTKPWLYGQANTNGLIYLISGFWSNSNTHAQNLFKFTNLPAGHYALKDYFKWTDPSLNPLTASEWGTVTLAVGGTGYTYCTFR